MKNVACLNVAPLYESDGSYPKELESLKKITTDYRCGGVPFLVKQTDDRYTLELQADEPGRRIKVEYKVYPDMESVFKAAKDAVFDAYGIPECNRDYCRLTA